VPELEAKSLALATSLATAREVQALVDAEHGYPKECRQRNGQRPPAGVPCTIEHAHDAETIVDVDGNPIAYVHPLPWTALALELAAKIEMKTATEVALLKAAALVAVPEEIVK
jgi:hypothetical protein